MRVQVDHDHSDLHGYVYRGDTIGSIPLDGYLGTLIVAGNADIYIYIYVINYKYILYIYILTNQQTLTI